MRNVLCKKETMRIVIAAAIPPAFKHRKEDNPPPVRGAVPLTPLLGTLGVLSGPSSAADTLGPQSDSLQKGEGMPLNKETPSCADHFAFLGLSQLLWPCSFPAVLPSSPAFTSAFFSSRRALPSLAFWLLSTHQNSVLSAVTLLASMPSQNENPHCWFICHTCGGCFVALSQAGGSRG